MTQLSIRVGCLVLLHGWANIVFVMAAAAKPHIESVPICVRVYVYMYIANKNKNGTCGS